MTASSARTVLVTGAAGFIGRHVVSALLDRGFEVTAAVRRPLAAPLAARCARVLVGDLCEAAVRREALRGAAAVVHAAAYLPERMDDASTAETCLRVNALATLELAQAAAAAGVRRFVYLSGGSLYGPSAGPCTEDAAAYPTGYATPYLVSKLAGELYASHICGQSGLDNLILRVGSPYGPGEPRGKVIPTFLRLAARGAPLRVAAGGFAAYNFVYVADVADCVARAAASGPSGIYNVASGAHTTLLQLAETIAGLHSPERVVVEIAPATPGAFAGFPPLSVAKSLATWGLVPRRLAAGLRDYQVHLTNASE